MSSRPPRPPDTLQSTGTGGAQGNQPVTHAQWTRLHPLSPLVRFARSAAIVALIVGTNQASAFGTDQDRPLWLDFITLGLVLSAAFVSWLVTRWRVHGSELQIETGLLRRQSIRIPLARVQAIDVVRPVLARFLGLAELRVVVAGRGSAKGRLAYMSAEQATGVRARLLALAHGLESTTPEPPGSRFFELNNGRFFASLILLGATLGPLFSIVAVLLIILFTPVGVGFLGLLFVSAIAYLQLAFRRVNGEFDLSLSEAADGLRVERGLLQTQTETIPYGRIQAARLIEPVLWRPFGWCRLEIDVARQNERDETGGQMSRAILPVGTQDEGRALLAKVMPGSVLEAPARSRCPNRARLKAPLSFHNLAAWHHERYVYTRVGRLRRDTVVLPLDKAQSLRRRQGPVQRRLRLANLYVDSAGKGWKAIARGRDADEAERWLYELVDVARHARRTMTRPGT